MDLQQIFKKGITPIVKEKLLSDLQVACEIEKGTARQYIRKGTYIEHLKRLQVLADAFSDGSIDELFEMCLPRAKKVKAVKSEIEPTQTAGVMELNEYMK